jgi:hypothetical protein
MIGGRLMFFVASNINFQLAYLIFHKTVHLLKDIFSLGFRRPHRPDLRKLCFVLVKHSPLLEYDRTHQNNRNNHLRIPRHIHQRECQTSFPVLQPPWVLHCVSVRVDTGKMVSENGVARDIPISCWAQCVCSHPQACS